MKATNTKKESLPTVTTNFVVANLDFCAAIVAAETKKELRELRQSRRLTAEILQDLELIVVDKMTITGISARFIAMVEDLEGPDFTGCPLFPVDTLEECREEELNAADHAAGLSAHDFFLVCLFNDSMSTSEMARNWFAYSGEEGKLTTFQTYAADVRAGVYVKKAFKGVKVNVKKEGRRITAKAPKAYKKHLATLPSFDAVSMYFNIQ